MNKICVSKAALILCLSVAFAANMNRAHGQPPSVADTAAPDIAAAVEPAGIATSDVSKSVAAGQAELASDSTLDATLKSSLEKLYQQAEQSLQAAAESQKNAAQFVESSRGANAKLQSLKNELSEPIKNSEAVDTSQNADQISQQIATAKAKLATATDQAEALSAEPLRRQERSGQIPGEIAAAEKTISEIADQLALPAPANEKPIETRARVALLQARAAAAKARVNELLKEQAAYDATSDVLPLQKSFTDRQVAALRAEIDALQAALVERQATTVRDTTEALRSELKKVSDPLKSLAQSNIELSERHQELVGEMATATKTLNDIEQVAQAVQADLKTSQDRLKAVGLTDALGLMFRNRRNEYDALRQQYAPRKDLKERIQKFQVAAFELEDEEAKLEQEIAEAASKATAADTGTQDNGSAGGGLDRLALLKKRKELVLATLQTQNGLLKATLNGDTQRRLLLQVIDQYTDFVDEQVFWTRSAPAFSPSELADIPAAAKWMVQPDNWSNVIHHALSTFFGRPLTTLGYLAIVLGLFSMKPRFRLWIRELGQEAKRYSARFSATAGTLLCSVLLASVWPAAFLCAGWLLIDNISGDSFVHGVGYGFLFVALFIAPRSLLRAVCRDEGLADAHFGWDRALRSMLRFHLSWYTVLGSILIFFMVVWHEHPNPQVRAMTARLSSVCLFAVIALFNHFVFRVQSPLFSEFGRNFPDSRVYRSRYVIWLTLVLSPIVFALMSMAGYLDTAFRLGKSIQSSILLLVLILLLVGFAFRWLTLRYRDIAIKQAREKREKMRTIAKAPAAESLSEEVGIELVADETADLPALGRQTRHTVTTVATVAAAARPGLHLERCTARL